MPAKYKQQHKPRTRPVSGKRNMVPGTTSGKGIVNQQWITSKADKATLSEEGVKWKSGEQEACNSYMDITLLGTVMGRTILGYSVFNIFWGGDTVI